MPKLFVTVEDLVDGDTFEAALLVGGPLNGALVYKHCMEDNIVLDYDEPCLNKMYSARYKKKGILHLCIWEYVFMESYCEEALFDEEEDDDEF